MKKRYIYSLLFGVPGFPVALLAAFILFGAATGFLWIFVLGDDPWPPAAGKLLPVLFILALLSFWIAITATGFTIGRKLEAKPGMNSKHILASALATAAPILLIVFHQASVGNIGKQTGSLLCSGFCREKGYTTSGMPPQDSGDLTCTCFDHHGREALKTLLHSITPDP